MEFCYSANVLNMKTPSPILFSARRINIRHPGHWHLIDYVIVRARDQWDVLHWCWRRLNPDGLHEPATQQRLQVSLGKSLQLDYPEDHWNSQIHHSWCLLKILRHKTRKHLDWFDENDRTTDLKKKWKAFRSWQNDISCKTKRLTHFKAKSAGMQLVRELRKSWWTDKVEIQRLAVAGDTRGLFSSICGNPKGRWTCAPIPHSRPTPQGLWKWRSPLRAQASSDSDHLHEGDKAECGNYRGMPTARKMQRTNAVIIHCFHRRHKGLWHTGWGMSLHPPWLPSLLLPCSTLLAMSCHCGS